MAVVEINDLASLGQINDQAPYQIPPEAWTLVENMRFSRSRIEVMSGWNQIFGTPTVAPHFAIPVKTATQTWWLYTSLTNAGVYDGASHADITRAVGGNYTANNTQDWNGLVFGGIPILNNGSDVPQYWSAYNITQKLQALPNWPGTLRASILRALGSYLVAFNIVDSGVSFPHLVQWSNPASPGSVPTSWAYSDPTVEGGRQDLADVNSGIIREALSLQGTMFIYKERSVWKMNYIGGKFIFSFTPFLTDVGILAPRCVCTDGSGLRHVVATQDDIIVHNGNSSQSILTDRQRITLFESSLNRYASDTCFMFLNRRKDEVWFCYPEQGQTQPSRALVWNYKDGKGAISFASGITFRNAAFGDVEGVSAEQWNQGTDTWDQDTGAWADITKGRIVLSSPANSKFYQLDSGLLRDGATFAPTLQRTDLGVLGKKRTGEWINDFKLLKMVDSIWPKVTGAPIRVRVGFRDAVGGNAPLVWQDYTTFNSDVDMWVSTIVNESLPGCGRAVSVEFSALTSDAWAIDGYSMNVQPLGPF